MKISSFLANRKLNKKRGVANWLDPKVETLPRMLKRAGYATGHFGKWHLGGQRDVGDAPLITEYGFDQSLTNFEGLGPRILPLKDAYDGKPPKKHALGSDKLGRGKIEWMDRSKITSRFVREAISFVDQAQVNQKPFYINLWPDDVHSPFFPPEGTRGDNAKRTLYHAVLSSMDQQLDALFQRIEKDPQLKNNTLILVASDNGPEEGAGSAGVFRGFKRELWEGGIRSPLIVWGPGLVPEDAQGTTNNKTILSAIDLVPSLAEVANVKPGKDFTPDGENLADAVLGVDQQQRSRPLYWRRPPGHKKFNPGFQPELAIREGDWKLVCRIDGSSARLFNLIDDPSESKNLIHDKVSLADRLLGMLRVWNAQLPRDASAHDYDRWYQPEQNETKKLQSSSENSKSPNVVVILADDLGWNAVGYHNTKILTPNIDSLANDGVKLEYFYVAPMCSPTRAGLMTGKYPIRFGCARAVIPPYRDFGLPPSETSLGEVFEKIGYTRRGVFGKWHLGHRRAIWHPLLQGFTHFEGHYNGAIDYFKLTREDQRDWHEGFRPSDREGYATDLIAESASQFIRESASLGSPYFCYVPFNAPHSPFQVPEEELERVKLENVDGINKKTRKRRRTYAAMVQRMDQGIGKILEAIRDTGQEKNTIVWFFSDNGGVGNIPENNLPLRGSKLTVYEGGIRVPACLRWPAKLKPGQVFDLRSGYIDVFPTLVAATETTMPKEIGPIDGINLLPALLGSGDAKKGLESREWYSYHGQQGESKEHLSIHVGKYKLKVNGPVLHDVSQLFSDSHQVELFVDDHLEKNNQSKKQSKIVTTLGKKLIAHRALQPQNSIPPYKEKSAGFIAPNKWQLDSTQPFKLIGTYHQ